MFFSCNFNCNMTCSHRGEYEPLKPKIRRFKSVKILLESFLLVGLLVSLFLISTLFDTYVIKRDKSQDCNGCNYILGPENDSFKNINKSYKLVCYYQFPVSETDLLPEMIDNLCTHILLAFAGINSTNMLQLSNDNLEVLAKIKILKAKDKKLKVLISVGGAGQSNFSTMVLDHANRKQFIKSVIVLLKTYQLDGVDLDWEWPVFDGGAREKVTFIQLLYELREEFNRHEKEYTLSVAVAAAQSIIDAAYYVNYMAQYVDFVSVMAYDYHFYTTYYPVTDYNAPLYSSAKDANTVMKNFNVNFSVKYWLSQSMPREKLVLGLPAYGHTYKLSSSLNHDLHAPSTGIGSIGQGGFASYSQICDFLKKPKTVSVTDNDSQVPYAYNFLDWISYDDEVSLKIKAEYIVKHDLAGGMIWSLNNDDYIGKCRTDNFTFPLVKAVRSILLTDR